MRTFLLAMLLVAGARGAYCQDDSIHVAAFSATVNTSNAFTVGDGTNSIALHFADSLNSGTVVYNSQYHNIGKISNRREIVYPDRFTTHYLGEKRTTAAQHALTVGYQHEEGKYLVAATLYGISSPQHEQGTRTAAIVGDNNSTYNGTGTYRLAAEENSLAADIYYRYQWAPRQELAVDVVNSVAATYSTCSQTMAADLLSASDSYDYTLYAHTNNHAYGLRATAQYSAPFLGGESSIIARYEYKQLRQGYSGVCDHLHSHNGQVSAGEEWHWRGGVALAPTVGVDIFNTRSATEEHTTVLPYLHLTAGWHNHGWAVLLAATMAPSVPTLTDLSASSTYLDPWLRATGTPSLTSSWKIDGTLRVAYTTRDERFTAALVVAPSYDKHHVATAVSVDGDVIVLSPQDIGGDFECREYLYLTVVPLRGVVIAPFLENDISHFSTPVRDIRESYWRGGGTVSAAWRQWQLTATVVSPLKRYDSNLIARSGWQAHATLQYTLRQWTIGAEYSYTAHNTYIYADTPRITYYDNNDARTLHHCLRLNLSYTLTAGHARRHHSPTPTTSTPSRDNGLTKFSTPRLP